MGATCDEVIAYLKECPGAELSEILRQVFEVRPEAEDEGEAFRYRMVLGMAASENMSAVRGETDWGPWQIAVVAGPDPTRYPPGFEGEPFRQYGECEECGVDLCSHVKQALCPFCAASVHLT